MPTPKYTQLVAPSMFDETGGIQTYSRLLLQALEELSSATQIDVFLKNDRQSELSRYRSNFYHFGSLPSPIRTPAFCAATAANIWCKRPELVISTHLHYAPPIALGSIGTKSRNWIVAHGVEAWDNKRPAVCRALKTAERILSVSEFTKTQLIAELGVDPAKVVVFPNSFEEERFELRPKPQYLLDRYKLSADQKIVMTLARLDRREQYKGYDRVLEAFHDVLKVFPNAHYILAGAGDDLERVKYLIRKIGLEAHVTLAGFVPESELCDHYNLCDVFAMPSTGEGFGIVFLEAIACGKPVLAGNRDGSVDAVLGGKLGALVDPFDQVDLTQTLISLLRCDHSNQALFNPDWLRSEITKEFGFSAFKSRLQTLLES